MTATKALRSIVLVLASLGLAACSLGEGVTPDCNLDGTSPTCDPAPACDDGKGGLIASPECCLERANDQYNLTCMAENAAGKDFRELCKLNNMGENVPCCNAATTVYQGCIPK